MNNSKRYPWILVALLWVVALLLLEAAAVATKTVKKEAVTTPPVPTPPKPKAVFGGGTSTTTSGNNADSYNGKTDQGIAGGKGDQGKGGGRKEVETKIFDSRGDAPTRNPWNRKRTIRHRKEHDGRIQQQSAAKC